MTKSCQETCQHVSNVVLKFKSTGSHHKKKRPGPKKKLSSRDERKLVRLIKSNRIDSVRYILGEYNEYNDCEISKRTFDRCRKKLGLSRRIAGKNQVLGKRHQLARVKWTVVRKGLTVHNYWKNVIITDECTIKVGQAGCGTMSWCGSKQEKAVLDRISTGVTLRQRILDFRSMSGVR